MGGGFVTAETIYPELRMACHSWMIYLTFTWEVVVFTKQPLKRGFCHVSSIFFLRTGEDG